MLSRDNRICRGSRGLNPRNVKVRETGVASKASAGSGGLVLKEMKQSAM